MSSAPTPPNYQPLFDLAQQGTNYSWLLSKDNQDLFNKTYSKNVKIGDIVIDKALGEMDKSIADSDRARARYQGIYEPLEEQQAYRAQTAANPQTWEEKAGAAEADVGAKFEQARQAAQQRLESYGVDPSQTRSAALDLGSRVAQAASSAAAGNQARQQAQEYSDQLMANAVNVGRGYPGQVLQEQQAAGQFGNQSVNVPLAVTQSGAQTLGTGPQWQQIGNQSLGTWGNLLNQSFSNQMDAWKADQDSSSGIGSVIGALGGIATAFLEEGGAIPEYAEGGRSIPDEASPTNGAIPDDVPAQIQGGPPARLNAGEFVVPKDVVGWLGEKGMQAIIMKARKEMAGGDKTRPAQPSMGPPGPQFDSVGAIPA